MSDLVASAQQHGQPAIAVTDHGSLDGWYTLHQATAGTPVTPIYGVEAYLAIGSRHDRNMLWVDSDDTTSDESGEVSGDQKSRTYQHLTLLAENSAGFSNIIAMVNESEHSFWRQPRIDYPLLKQYGEGVIVLTGCIGGPVAGPLSRGNIGEARTALDTLIDCVGVNNVYVEIMDHGFDLETRTLPALVELAHEYGLPLVATNDCHYTHAEDADAHAAWLCVSTKTNVHDPKRFQFNGTGYHIRSTAQMRALHDTAWWQEACDNTLTIAERIGRDAMPPAHMRLPQYPLPDGYTKDITYLRDLVFDGAKKLYGLNPDDPTRLPTHVADRLNWEFTVISNAGTISYYLIVWDIINWARNQGILVGPGRGSGPGSLVAYCIGITQVDPLANGLLFERFLNPERAGLPDFDVDFQKDRRDEVVEYIANRYGHDRVARIGTHGMVRAKAALKDAARVLSDPDNNLMYGPVGNQLAAKIPVEGGKAAGFSDVLNPENMAAQDFRATLHKLDDQGARTVLDLAQRFEYVTRSRSIHACGVLIADEPMDHIVPLRNERKEGLDGGSTRVTAWDGRELDAHGFLKMDVLGLRNLDVIAQTLTYIRDTTGEHINMLDIRPDNPADLARAKTTWELLASGRTAGVFQLESDGMRELTEQVKPTSLNDLTALGALYRPGPMAAGMHTRYAERKNGREAVSYDYLTTDRDEQAVIANVLDTTYGTIVYQEQIMQLGGDVAGLTPGMRNKLQKAFSKKNKTLMDEVKVAFMDGAHNGAGPAGVRFSAGTLTNLWETFEGSASYLFNKSHACAYGYVTYITAYLKANWPTQYGAALLARTERDKVDKRVNTMTSLLAEGVYVHPPHVNVSRQETAPTPDLTGIVFGLTEVKGVGVAGHAIVAEREQRGPFTSLYDLVKRCKDAHGKPLSNGVLVALAEAGALDQFGSRRGIVQSLHAIRDNPNVIVAGEWDALELTARQRDRLGVTTGEHPVDVYRPHIRAWLEATRKGNVVPLESVAQCVGATVWVPALLTGATAFTYSKGTRIAVSLEGGVGVSVRGVMWNDDYVRAVEHGDLPAVDTLVLAKVRPRTVVVELETEDENGDSVVEQITRVEVTVVALEPIVFDRGLDGLPDGGLLPIPAVRNRSVVVRSRFGELLPSTLPCLYVPGLKLTDSSDGVRMFAWNTRTVTTLLVVEPAGMPASDASVADGLAAATVMPEGCWSQVHVHDELLLVSTTPPLRVGLVNT